MDRIITSMPTSPIRVREGECIHTAGIFEKGWDDVKKISIHVAARGALDMYVLFLGQNDSAFDHEFYSVQQGPHSRVRYFFRSVLFDSSRLRGTAMVHITPQGSESNAFFSHHILLLSNSAQGTTTPSLEIESEQATARHAASVSTLDDESLFYLATRGCDEKKSEQLLIKGFLMSDLSTNEDNDLKIAIEYKVDSFLKLRNRV